MATKQELKEKYSAPALGNFANREEYLEAKHAWVEANPGQYKEICEAPHGEIDNG